MDTTYGPKVFFDRGGDRLNVAAGGTLNVEGTVVGPTPGANYYVDSGSGAAANDGLSWAKAKATLAQAVALCSADSGDVVHVAPGHNEGIGAAETIDLNVAGITVRGYGVGTGRPRFDFDHATAGFNIAAHNVTITNLSFLPSVTAVAIGIDVEAGKTDARILHCEFLPGEDGAGVDEFAIGIDIKAGCARTQVEGCRFTQHASAAGVVAGVSLTGASDLVAIRDCVFWCAGAGLTAPINGLTTLSTRLLVERCVLVADDEPGIELLTGTTGVIRDCDLFTNLATIAAAIVADGCAKFRNEYVELGNERGALVGTASVDD